MMQVQAPGRVLHGIRNQLAGGYRIFEEQGFKKCNPVLFSAVRVRQSPASKTESQNGAVYHRSRDLVPVLIAQRIECFVDASDRNWEINWVSIPFRQMVAAWLNWDGFFLLYF